MSRSGMLDAEQFLRVSEALREGFARLGSVSMPESARGRWQRRLIAITDVAKQDLSRAEEQCARFRVDFTREFGEAGARGAARRR